MSGPILLLGRKRIRWGRWQLLLLVIPFCVWLALMYSPLAEGRKGFLNIGEVIYISCGMPVLALLRVAIGPRLSERIYAVSFITALCCVAVGVFLLTPNYGGP